MDTVHESELRGLRVLVVEDSFSMALVIETTLKALGCVVTGVAPRLDAALTLIEAPLDCVILDLNLDGEDAYPVADILRRRGVPFLLTTGYDGSAVHPELQDAPRLEKPFDMDTLVVAMRGAFLPKRA